MTNESRPSKYFNEGAIIFTLCVLHCGEIWLAVSKYILQLYTLLYWNLVYICFKRIFFLSDPLYTLSSDRDHARATFKAHTGTDRIVRLKYDVHSLIALIFRVSFQFRTVCFEAIVIKFHLFSVYATETSSTFQDNVQWPASLSKIQHPPGGDRPCA